MDARGMRQSALFFPSMRTAAPKRLSLQPAPRQPSPPNQATSQQLEKARLFSIDHNSLDFEFMFNPSQLDLKWGVKTKEDGGARTAQGQPKVNFEYPEVCTLTISKIIFYTYEEGESVLNKYIKKLEKSVEFVKFSSGNTSTQRPPIYVFVWGNQQYMRCFVKSLQYKLTMFLPDGTPVRAEVNLTLTEVDETIGSPNPRTYDPARFGDRDTRSSAPPPSSVKAALAKQYEEESKALDTKATELRAKLRTQEDMANRQLNLLAGMPLGGPSQQAMNAAKEAALRPIREEIEKVERQSKEKTDAAKRLRQFLS